MRCALKPKFRDFAEKLLEWWERNKRIFPWLLTNDPYKILVAELLLRKTTAGQVAKMYNEFLSKYPHPASLAEADEDELAEVLKPLGMYRVRAKLFKKLGNILVVRYGGHIPSSKSELMKLPGVKEYVANAVLCFAYNKDLPLVDTNAIRVAQRVFGVKSSRKRARNDPKIWRFMAELLPKGRAKEFNWAVIDFASLICTARKPNCTACPLASLCMWPDKSRA